MLTGVWERWRLQKPVWEQVRNLVWSTAKEAVVRRERRSRRREGGRMVAGKGWMEVALVGGLGRWLVGL